MRITKMEFLNWKDIEPIQPKGFKDLTESDVEHFKNNLLDESGGFAGVFLVWQDKKKKVWLLDGKQRKNIMLEMIEDGVEVPELMPCAFVDCKSKKEAGQFVLRSQSQLGRLNELGLSSFCEMYKIDLEPMVPQLSIPNIDLELCIPSLIPGPNDINEYVEFNESVNFTIKCSDMNELDELKELLGIKSNGITFQKFKEIYKP
jgi:hypothetical protein